jgi:hypothetical protein
VPTPSACNSGPSSHDRRRLPRLAASADSIRCVLVEVVARIVSTETTLYLSNRNYITASGDTPASTAYTACIAGGVSTTESLSLDGPPA